MKDLSKILMIIGFTFVFTSSFAGEKCLKDFYKDLDIFITKSKHGDVYLSSKKHISFVFEIQLNSEGVFVSCDILQFDNANLLFANDLNTFLESMEVPCLYSHFCSPIDPEFGENITIVMPFKPSVPLAED